MTRYTAATSPASTAPTAVRPNTGSRSCNRYRATANPYATTSRLNATSDAGVHTAAHG